MNRKIAFLSAFLPLAGCGPAMGTSGATAAVAEQGRVRYVQRNLVSDGFVPAEQTDSNLVNAWGITHLPTSPWWVSDNGTNVTTLYDANGIAQPAAQPLVVSVTGAGGNPADPTGNVANAGTGFVVSIGAASGPARFIFASEDGTISGWNPGVPPPVPPATRSTQTVVMVDESSAEADSGAVFKGLALASTPAGDRLFATNFRDARVEVFDTSFANVTAPGSFVDPGIPAGFAPFGIAAVEDTIVVTYAKQDAHRHDDVAGRHLGYVSAFSPDGTFLGRVASRGKLNSPWGLALAPAGFGAFSGHLLVGNFGDGHLIAYRMPDAGKHRDAEEEGEGRYVIGQRGPIVIDGLWGLGFGNGATAGPVNTLFFAAGPGGEAHGLFGRIDPAPDR